MFLHKLELQGFKSFVDRTDIQFGTGITGIVGPNGCGKTNLTDAIRWVLGEQSAKQLRGDSMEDVIFSGSLKRKPVGMAEVTLTLLNDRGALPTEYTEVQIGRRVYRNGSSEYFLNKTAVRLRDIRDLFYGTGMGSHAYSVIERSMVDHVLSDASGHRRFLFEEASDHQVQAEKARGAEQAGGHRGRSPARAGHHRGAGPRVGLAGPPGGQDAPGAAPARRHPRSRLAPLLREEPDRARADQAPGRAAAGRSRAARSGGHRAGAPRG